MEGDSDTRPDAQLAQTTATDPALNRYEDGASSGEENKGTSKIAEDLDRLQILPLSVDVTAFAISSLAPESVPSAGPAEDGGTVTSQLPSSGHSTEAESTNIDSAAAVAMEAEMAALQMHLAVVASAARESAGGGFAAPKQQGKVLENVLETLIQQLGLTRTLATFKQEWQASSPRSNMKGSDTISHRQSSSTSSGSSSSSSTSRSSSSGGGSQEPFTTAAAAVVEDALPPAVGVLLRKLLHEREMLSMHYRQAVQEREKLAKDTKNLQRRYAEYEPLIAELRSKYDAVLREKTLVSIQHDRLAEQLRKVNLMQEGCQQEVAMGSPTAGQQQQETIKAKSLPNSPAPSRPPWRPATAVSGPAGQHAAPGRPAPPASLPVDRRQNPYNGLVLVQTSVQSFTVQRTLASHSQPVTSLTLHPSKPLGVSTCKDGSWSMWHAETGDLVMTGRGHKGSITCAQFHPEGTSLATAAEDGTIQLWSFERQKLTATLGGPDAAAVTSLAFHDTGSFLASGTADGVAHLWDLTTFKRVQAFRGHTGAITGVAWQPYTNMLATSSADATVCLWEARIGLCCQTLSAHVAPCTSLAFNLKGDRLATTDAAGAVLVWDSHSWRLQTTIPAGAAVHACVFDISGQLLLAATQTGAVRCFDSTAGTLVASLNAQAGPLEAVAAHCNGQYVLAAGDDGSVKAWQCA